MPKYPMPLLILTYGGTYLGIASGANDLEYQMIGSIRFPKP
jgi:hypothetical protein